MAESGAAQLVAEAQKWIELILEESFPAGFDASLRSGVRLCNLVNTIWPRSIPRVHKDGARRNLDNYLAACKKLGLKDEDLFQPEEALEGGASDKVAANVLCLKKVVQDRVPHHDLQMLLVHVAGIRRKLHDQRGGKAAPRRRAAEPPRRRWSAKRPPAPPLPRARQADGPSALPRADRVGQDGEAASAVSASASASAPASAVSGGIAARRTASPSMSSVSSASSLSTLESSRSQGGSIGGAFGTLAMLEAAAKTSLMTARTRHASCSLASWSALEAADADELSQSGLSLSSFEDLGSVGSQAAAHGEEDGDWVNLRSPRHSVDAGGASTRLQQEHDCLLERLGVVAGAGDEVPRLTQGDISRVLQFELGSESGRAKLWSHFVAHEQRALMQAPWRKGVLSASAACEGPQKRTLKLLLRHGVPPGVRVPVWLMCTGAAKRLAVRQGAFVGLLGGAAPSVEPPGTRVVRAQRSRCSGLVDRDGRLARVCGFLVAQCGDAEAAAFWLSVNASEFMLPLDYYATGLALEVDVQVLATLLRDADPELSAHLDTFGDGGVARQLRGLGAHEWLAGMFVGSGIAAGGGQELACRVWDRFCFQGDKALFATALALLQAARLDVLASSKLAEARASLDSLAAALRNPGARDDAHSFFELMSANCEIVSRKRLKALRQRAAGPLCDAVARRSLETAAEADATAWSTLLGAAGASNSKARAAALLRYLRNARAMLRRMEAGAVLALGDAVSAAL